jgi:hypothetical protein
MPMAQNTTTSRCTTGSSRADRLLNARIAVTPPCTAANARMGGPEGVRREAPNNPSWAKLSGLSLSCFAQKACDLPSSANPARRIRLALFRTFRTLSNAIHLGAQHAP